MEITEKEEKIMFHTLGYDYQQDGMMIEVDIEIGLVYIQVKIMEII